MNSSNHSFNFFITKNAEYIKTQSELHVGLTEVQKILYNEFSSSEEQSMSIDTLVPLKTYCMLLLQNGIILV